MAIAILAVVSCSSETPAPQTTHPDSTVEKVPTPEVRILAEAPDFDTLLNRKKVSAFNSAYLVQLREYSLNDSSIVKEFPESNQQVRYHQRATELTISLGSDTVVKRVFTADSFSEEADPEFFKQAVLQNCVYQGVRSDLMYFMADLIVPDTDWLCHVRFNVYYRGSHKGEYYFSLIGDQSAIE